MISQARDEILAVFRTAWLASDTSKELPVKYPDVRFTPPKSGAWAAITVQHMDGGQASLANHSGVRAYENIGTVTVQIFTESGNGQVLSDELVQLVVDSYRGTRTSSGVIFHKVRPVEVGTSGTWYQVNVVANFEYTEVR